jgi:large subunit ribosomal protein L19
MSSILSEVKNMLVAKVDHPSFSEGDNISVHYKIVEGAKERIQIYRGDVIYSKGEGAHRVFCVRKLTNGVGVERIFPINSPMIDLIEVHKQGRVRRAKLYYIRELTGKAMRIKEKRSSQN